MIDSLIFGIPIYDNIPVMELSTGFLKLYLSKRIFFAKILVFKGMKSFTNIVCKC